MEYRQLGRSGLRVSLFSLGSWVTYGGSVDDAVARKCLLAAYERGVNFFDNAEVYAGGRAEEVVGEVLSELRREDLVLSSKVFWGGKGPNDTGLSAKHVIEGCHGALRRLRTDHLDLYYCHRPDPHTPIEETVRAMDILVRQGKVLYWGTSEWPASKIIEACQVAERRNMVPPTVEQPQYNLFHREAVEHELKQLCEVYGLGLTVWSPLASGLLTGKYNDGIPEGSRLASPRLDWLRDRLLTEDKLERTRRLGRIAEGFGCSLAQLALAWAAKNPCVSSVITGASRPEQVVENIGALPVLTKLNHDHLDQIDAILEGRPERHTP